MPASGMGPMKSSTAASPPRFSARETIMLFSMENMENNLMVAQATMTAMALAGIFTVVLHTSRHLPGPGSIAGPI